MAYNPGTGLYGINISVNDTIPGLNTPNTFTATNTFNNGIVSNVTGNLTGNVTGNLTGNVTGNLTGNVTGDVTGTASGNLKLNSSTDQNVSGAQINFTNSAVVFDNQITADVDGVATGNLKTGDSVINMGDVTNAGSGRIITNTERNQISANQIAIAANALNITTKASLTQVNALLLAKADDNAVVKLTGAQTIAGAKTFSDTIVGTTNGNLVSADIAGKADISDVVQLSGAQTIAGAKTFSDTIVGTTNGNLVSSDIAGKADISDVVTLAGNQNITGTKTFSNTIVGTTNGNLVSADIAGKANDNAVVKLTGNQTIAGSKTFSNTIVGTTNGNLVSADIQTLQNNVQTLQTNVQTLQTNSLNINSSSPQNIVGSINIGGGLDIGGIFRSLHFGSAHIRNFAQNLEQYLPDGVTDNPDYTGPLRVECKDMGTNALRYKRFLLTHLDGNNVHLCDPYATAGTESHGKHDPGSGTRHTFQMGQNLEVDGEIIAGGDGNVAGTIKLKCDQNQHTVTLKAPPHGSATNYTLVLPNDAGTSGQVLQTNGSGVLSWATASSGGSGGSAAITCPFYPSNGQVAPQWPNRVQFGTASNVTLKHVICSGRFTTSGGVYAIIKFTDLGLPSNFDHTKVLDISAFTHDNSSTMIDYDHTDFFNNQGARPQTVVRANIGNTGQAGFDISSPNNFGSGKTWQCFITYYETP